MKDSILLTKADLYAYKVYHVTKQFPREEIFGITSQLRRAALSVPLNIIEGFARHGSKEFRQFLRMSYASLQESQYLIDFSQREKYIDAKDAPPIVDLGTEVARMLWASMKTLQKSL